MYHTIKKAYHYETSVIEMTFSSVSNNHLYSKSISMLHCDNLQPANRFTSTLHRFLAHFLLYPDLDSVNVLLTPSKNTTY